MTRLRTVGTVGMLLAAVLATAQPTPEDAERVRFWRSTTPEATAAQSADLRDRLSAAEPTSDRRASAVAAEVKRSPIYRAGADARASSNWMSRGLRALGRFIANLFDRPANPPNMGDVPRIGPILNVIMWFVLGAAALIGLGLAARHFRWVRRTRTSSVGLLEDDEPDRTADEWLSRADGLAAEGRHREAVRCLYLACLARLDEAGVARFIRSETNWEHLRRIEGAPRRPADLDFRRPTQRFDRVWYGQRVDGMADVAAARTDYEELCRTLAA